MIISQTPLRISFVGGGTDIKEFYTITPGCVISATIDKYVYVIIKERFDDYIYVGWSNKRERVSNVRDIEHDLVREALKKTGITKGIEITTFADIPSAGSGLGSSSSITVGLLNAMYNFNGNQVTPKMLAEEACDIEIEILQRPMGKQDQYIAAYGGLKEFVFNPDDSVLFNNIKCNNKSRRGFGSNIMLFYTDITRKSSEILTHQAKATKKQLNTLIKMRDQVFSFKEILENNISIESLGLLIDEGWRLKKSLVDNISNNKIEKMYKKAINSGAFGGKISGAGGGGFLMLFVPKEKQESVREELKEYRELPFLLEPYGSKIIFNMERGLWK